MEIFFLRKNFAVEPKEISSPSNFCIQISKHKKPSQTTKKNADLKTKPMKIRNKSLPKGEPNLFSTETTLALTENVKIFKFLSQNSFISRKNGALKRIVLS